MEFRNESKKRHAGEEIQEEKTPLIFDILLIATQTTSEKLR